MKVPGIDISKWEGNFNLSKAKSEGFEFVIVKGGGGDDGLYRDSKFLQNYTKAKTLKMPVGCYWFSKALTIEDAIIEANYFYENCLKGRSFELPIYIDVENKTQLAVGKKLLTDIILTWFETLQKKGYLVGIYSSKSYFANYMEDDRLQDYPHWVAQWGKTCTYKGKTKDVLGMWQYGGETNKIRSTVVAGEVCDQNYMLIDYPSLIKEKGLNGFSKVKDPAPKKKKDSQIALEVIQGKWSNGTERKTKLEKAGYSYSKIQKIVNVILAVMKGKYGNGEERRKKLESEGFDYFEIQSIVNVLMR